MNAHAESVVSPVVDVVKHFASAILVISGIVAFYHFSDVMLLYRVLGLLVIIAVVLGLEYTTVIGQRVWLFSQESRKEVRKVVWPTRSETMQTTLMVFAMVFVVGLVLWFLDMFLFWAVRMLTGQGG
jgi:preprotein translocase subunit SecE